MLVGFYGGFKRYVSSTTGQSRWIQSVESHMASCDLLTWMPQSDVVCRLMPDALGFT